MNDPLIFQALGPMIQTLDALGISYQIGHRELEIIILASTAIQPS